MTTGCRRAGLGLATALTSVALCAIAASPAAAVGIAGAERLDTATWGALASDGERHVAYVRPDGRLRVIDEASRPRTSFVVDAPAGCAPDGRPLAVGAGQVVVRCWTSVPGRAPSSPGDTKRLEIATRTWHDVPGGDRWDSDKAGRPDLLWLTGVGKRWIEYERSGRHGTRWVDWRTGQVREDDGDIRDAPDLDDERLFRRMCGPLARPLPETPLSAQTFQPTAYEQPYALSLHSGFELTIQRCGERRATVLGTSLDLGQLGGGVVTWQGGGWEGVDLMAYLPACRLRIGWASGFSVSGWIAHVRGAVYLLLGDQVTHEAHIERIPLPRGCPAGPRPAVVTGGSGSLRVAASSWSDPSGARGRMSRVPGPGAAVPRTGRVSGALTVRLPAPAREVQWRVGDQREAAQARRVGRDGRRWRLTLPRRAGRYDVTVDALDRRKVATTYAFRAERVARR